MANSKIESVGSKALIAAAIYYFGVTWNECKHAIALRDVQWRGICQRET
jgi:hypothetical protein